MDEPIVSLRFNPLRVIAWVVLIISIANFGRGVANGEWYALVALAFSTPLLYAATRPNAFGGKP